MVFVMLTTIKDFCSFTKLSRFTAYGLLTSRVVTSTATIFCLKLLSYDFWVCNHANISFCCVACDSNSK